MKRPARVAAAALLLAARAALAGVFPYPVTKETLPNGLDVVVIQTPEFKDVLSYNTLVMAGSGKEHERGATGLAHLFEHILFRHRYHGEDGGYEERMNRLGTHNNAWTWFDVTYYHPLTFISNFDRSGDPPGVVELEAARFTSLDFSEKTFKTEAGAVLGEYRKAASQPGEKMEERLFELMFPGSPYGHTTMGYYQDVIDMPSHYEAARRFYDEWYRPNHCALVIAGDVTPAKLLPKIREKYGKWEAKEAPHPPSGHPLPQAGEGTSSKDLPRNSLAPRERGEGGGEGLSKTRDHIAWDSDVAPQVWVAYRMPAFHPGTPDSAAAELLQELLVSPAAPLYKKLRYEKQTASVLNLEEGRRGFESVESRAIILTAQLYKDQYAAKGRALFDDVAGDIAGGLEALKSFSSQPGAAELLKAVKSKYRNDFLSDLASPSEIAETFALYYRFDRDPAVLDKLLASVEALSPEDIDRLARAQFTPANRVVITMAYERKK